MSSINSEYTQLINQFKNEVGNISIEALNELEQTISNFKSTQNITEDIINAFENQINTILSDAQEHLEHKQNEFYDLITSMASSISNEIEEIKTIIEQKKQETLLQINKSENSAINRLEETYDIGVATILSAEKTALHNLGFLTEELIKKIQETAENVDSKINEKLEEALKKIEEFTASVAEEIKEIEIIIKEEIKEEARKIIEEVYQEIENIKIDMKNFSALLKKELTEYKDLMLEEIRQDKEKFFIEMDREQNRILEVLRLKEYEIITNLNKKEQAIISNIIMVVAGYDREIEILKQAKLNEFIDALELIANQTIKDIVHNAEEVFKSKIDEIIQEIKDIIIEDTAEEVRKLLNEFAEQRYELVLPAGETIIKLPKAEFTITNRLKLFLDGTLQVRNKHYTIDSKNRIITLTRAFPDDLDVIVTEDFPNQDIQTQLQNALQQIKNSKNDSLEEINQEKENAKQEIQNKIPDWVERLKIETLKIYEFYKNDFEKYVEQWKENKYISSIPSNTQVIQIPISELKLNTTAKIYFDGILQIQEIHYTVDFSTNSITILQPFEETIDLTILQNIPPSESQGIQGRPATDEEIDSLFNK